MRDAKLQVLRRLPQDQTDAFHPDRVQDDLAKLASSADCLSEIAERLRIRFRKAGERAVLEHWTALYTAADRLIAARNDMERRKSEYLQLAREHDLKDTEKSANVTKLQADIEEENLRREKAAYQRQHVEQFNQASPQGSNASENQQKFTEADERRQFDARWELNESMRSLHTLIELQHWRRQQRDQILQDRSLSPDEQAEAMQFVDDLYRQKHSELKVDTRIFEDR